MALDFISMLEAQVTKAHEAMLTILETSQSYSKADRALYRAKLSDAQAVFDSAKAQLEAEQAKATGSITFKSGVPNV